MNQTIRTLRAAVPKWTEQAGEAVADSNASEAYSIATDPRPDPILQTPIPEILHRARELGRFDFGERIERDPFRGLSALRPTRALGALTHAARSGDAPGWAWSAFLRAEARSADSVRMIRTIAARLQRLPPSRLRDIAYPVSEWMRDIASRLYADAADVLPGLWASLMVALRRAEPEPRLRRPRSWATDALNAPVGKLTEFLMKDPAKDGLALGVGFPSQWTARLDNLLELPGDMRRHALVMLGYHLNWLFAIDPAWTESRLLSVVSESNPDGDALWDGVRWSARIPSSKPLFLSLKSALFARAVESAERNEKTIVAGFLLAGWEDEAPTGERLVTDVELREVLIHADDEFRQQLLWQLGRWSAEPDNRWREKVIPFFQRVWPKQRALHTPVMSSRLANFALDSGDLMPAVVELILPRLVPVRNGHLRFTSRSRADERDPVRAHPAATLDLLWAILGEDTSSWPYHVEDALAILAQAPETALNVRLAELRRRIDLP